MKRTTCGRQRIVPRAGRPAFTLVELLVSLGIIALILSILLPVLASARRASRAVACLAKLQQWSTGYQTYVGGHGGRGVPRGPIPFTTEQGTPPFWWEVLLPKGSVPEMLLCPEATEASNGMPVSSFHAWGPEAFYDVGGKVRGPFIGSYGFNAWLYAEFRADGSPGPTRRPPEKNPSSVPVVFDCARFEVYPFDTDQPKRFEPRATGSSGWMQLAAVQRHREGTNVAFLDGHAEHVLPARLWELRWSNEFRPKTVTIGP